MPKLAYVMSLDVALTERREAQAYATTPLKQSLIPDM
jgi:hypothetical protein